MRDGGPRNLKDMLAEAKNTSELMVDLAYAAVFYNSEDFSEEVFRLEERMNSLVFDMRSLAILAARSPADSEQMAGILQVVQDIEKIANAANDVAKIWSRSSASHRNFWKTCRKPKRSPPASGSTTTASWTAAGW